MKTKAGRNAPLSIDGAQLIAPKPEWIRLPKAGENEFFTGLKRDLISALCASGSDGSSPQVRSKIVRKDGARRHIRLVNLQSLLNYVEGLPEGLEQEGTQA